MKMCVNLFIYIMFDFMSCNMWSSMLKVMLETHCMQLRLCSFD